MAKLIVNPTSSSRREIPLTRTLMSIGRDPSNDVVLPDAMVSRRHAVIEYRGSQYFLRDCNSSNGSLVNGDRVSERSLRDGDLVAIGTARLLFRDDLDVDYKGAELEVGFNSLYLLDFLQSIGSERIRLELKDENSAAIMKPDLDEDIKYTYVLMPMKI